MPQIVRRFLDPYLIYGFQEAEPYDCMYMIEFVMMENGKILNDSVTLSIRKRHPEVFGYIHNAIYRASSVSELDDFQAHWSKDRV